MSVACSRTSTSRGLPDEPVARLAAGENPISILAPLLQATEVPALGPGKGNAEPGPDADLSALLETARESYGDRLRCKACGSSIPGVSKLKLGGILSVIRQLRAVLPGLGNRLSCHGHINSSATYLGNAKGNSYSDRP